MERKTKALTIGEVKPEFYEAVKKIAYEKDLTVAQFIKILIRDELKKNGIDVSYRVRELA